jgi:hypothetical protein
MGTRVATGWARLPGECQAAGAHLRAAAAAAAAGRLEGNRSGGSAAGRSPRSSAGQARCALPSNAAQPRPDLAAAAAAGVESLGCARAARCRRPMADPAAGAPPQAFRAAAPQAQWESATGQGQAATTAGALAEGRDFPRASNLASGCRRGGSGPSRSAVRPLPLLAPNQAPPCQRQGRRRRSPPPGRLGSTNRIRSHPMAKLPQDRCRSVPRCHRHPPSHLLRQR